ncbi:hypothetical protein BT96DRAFT_949110 [Gymnopus androsaceus JB14]|uniref:Uncharacterized protein n=1 Tax=Gymnopus androsaceus JB14 TaxID=1447944 RepID=A0A6A4GLU9_9AGAR|nr:hypothetical protein BT96DRAFT_949110 [Gymnopus androsaceus JB14]
MEERFFKNDRKPPAVTKTTRITEFEAERSQIPLPHNSHSHTASPEPTAEEIHRQRVRELKESMRRDMIEQRKKELEKVRGSWRWEIEGGARTQSIALAQTLNIPRKEAYRVHAPSKSLSSSR